MFAIKKLFGAVFILLIYFALNKNLTKKINLLIINKIYFLFLFIILKFIKNINFKYMGNRKIILLDKDEYLIA